VSRRRIVLALLTGPLAAACGGPVATESAALVVPVARGDFRHEVEAGGLIRAVRSTPVVAPRSDGMAKRIASLAPDGSRVEAGQVVASVDSSDLEVVLQDGEAALALAEREQQKLAAESEKSRGTLVEDQGATRFELDAARGVPPLDPGVFSKKEILEKELDRTGLASRLDLIDEQLDTSGRLAEAQEAVAGVEWSRARYSVETAREGLEVLEARAPHAGLFVLSRNWRGDAFQVGQTVWPGLRIAEIPDLSELEAQVDVLEADADGLEVGRPATVMVEGRPDFVFETVVARVEAVAKPKRNGSPMRYFETTLHFRDAADAAARLSLGQRVRARILLVERTDVLTVPRAAVATREGRHFVRVQRSGREEIAEVELGDSSASHAVVLSGLEAGDRVLLGGAPLIHGVAHPPAPEDS
jgi:multidrug efflux pump subunit AcrA (membrane-fusion protein)